MLAVPVAAEWVHAEAASGGAPRGQRGDPGVAIGVGAVEKHGDVGLARGRVRIYAGQADVASERRDRAIKITGEQPTVEPVASAKRATGAGQLPRFECPAESSLEDSLATGYRGKGGAAAAPDGHWAAGDSTCIDGAQGLAVRIINTYDRTAKKPPYVITVPVTGKTALVIVQIRSQYRPPLFQPGPADDRPGLIPRFLKGRQQQRYQQNDDGDHHQQLYQCESPPSVGAHELICTRCRSVISHRAHSMSPFGSGAYPLFSGVACL